MYCNQSEASISDNFLQDLLKVIGCMLRVSRSYIFEYCEETDTISNTCEWVCPGINPKRETLQNIPMHLNLYWQECMVKNQIIDFDNVREFPSFPENQILMELGVESILVVPIYIGALYYGFLGISECTQSRSWSEPEVTFMKAMAQLIGAMVKKSQQTIETALRTPAIFMQDLLKFMGRFLKVSRSYIFEYHEETDTMDNTYEWVCPGIEPQKEILQNIPMEINPFWQEHMLRNKAIIYNDVRDIPSFPENQVLLEQGIEAILVVPIFINGKYFGFLGVDECKSPRNWSDLEIRFLNVMAASTGALVEKNQLKTAG